MVEEPRHRLCPVRVRPFRADAVLGDIHRGAQERRHLIAAKRRIVGKSRDSQERP
jgi:hypothetical protein